MISVYIAGPMSGIDRFNFDAFDEAAARLRGQGHFVISPAEIDRKHGFDGNDPSVVDQKFRYDAMMRDLEHIGDLCNGVVLLPGWEDSRGAIVEAAFAKYLGLKIYLYPTMLEISDNLCLGPVGGFLFAKGS